jgi:hypothetical protein
MNRAQAHYLRIYKSTTDYELWQSYYVNKTVTVDSKNYQYFPFQTGGIQESSALGALGMSLTVPASQKAIEAFEAAINNQWLVEISVYEFDSRLGNGSPQSGQILITSFVGQVTSLSGSFTRLEIGLGSALATVGSQAPPRTFTTALVGNPLRI